jgi:hypothetical protein
VRPGDDPFSGLADETFRADLAELRADQAEERAEAAEARARQPEAGLERRQDG